MNSAIDIGSLTTFFGWMSVITVTVLALSALAMVLARSWIAGIHGKMFDLDERTLSLAYFEYLSRFKIAVMVFCLAPYIALKLMT